MPSSVAVRSAPPRGGDERRGVADPARRPAPRPRGADGRAARPVAPGRRRRRRRRLAAALIAVLLLVGLGLTARVLLFDVGLVDVEDVQVSGARSSRTGRRRARAPRPSPRGGPLARRRHRGGRRRVARLPAVASVRGRAGLAAHRDGRGHRADPRRGRPRTGAALVDAHRRGVPRRRWTRRAAPADRRDAGTGRPVDARGRRRADRAARAGARPRSSPSRPRSECPGRRRR